VEPTVADIEIRTATIDDLAGIFHLGERLFTSREFPNLYRTWDEYEVTGLFNSDTEYCLVAVVDAALAGFAFGTIIEKARTAWNYGHLIWLGVDPGFHRMGIASKLFDAFRDRMTESGVRMLMVDTQADNAAALAFFQRKGFSNPTDHLYLTLNLQG
jgi:ribosomal protein S18 acetylase RimI-like enzyme